MPFKKKTVWLCTGDYLNRKGKTLPCIYAKIDIVKAERPLFAGSFATVGVTELQIICTKTHKLVRHWVKECKHYQNSRLDIMFNKAKTHNKNGENKK